MRSVICRRNKQELFVESFSKEQRQVKGTLETFPIFQLSGRWASRSCQCSLIVIFQTLQLFFISLRVYRYSRQNSLMQSVENALSMYRTVTMPVRKHFFPNITSSIFFNDIIDVNLFQYTKSRVLFYQLCYVHPKLQVSVHDFISLLDDAGLRTLMLKLVRPDRKPRLRTF